VTTHKKAAIYARSVDHEGDTRSLAYQVAEGKKYCWSQGFRVDDTHVYQEVCSGAENKDRPAFTRLGEAARNKEFDIVVVIDFDRIGRTQQQVMFLAEMERYGIRVESIFKPFVGDTDMNRFIKQIHAAREQMEREQRAKRRKRARQHR
jgi:DNA invertase Pin-like site-specific DNA recombinase